MSVGKGNIFLIQIESGEFVPGQIIAEDKRGMLCISCGLFDQRVSIQNDASELKLDFKNCFSTLLVTPKSLDKDRWIIIGSQKLVIPKRFFPYEKEQKKGGVGAKIFDPGIVENFLNAYYSFKPWDMYYRADYFDSMLLDASKKPMNLIFSK